MLNFVSVHLVPYRTGSALFLVLRSPTSTYEVNRRVVGRRVVGSCALEFSSSFLSVLLTECLPEPFSIVPRLGNNENINR